MLLFPTHWQPVLKNDVGCFCEPTHMIISICNEYICLLHHYGRALWMGILDSAMSSVAWTHSSISMDFIFCLIAKRATEFAKRRWNTYLWKSAVPVHFPQCVGSMSADSWSHWHPSSLHLLSGGPPFRWVILLRQYPRLGLQSLVGCRSSEVSTEPRGPVRLACRYKHDRSQEKKKKEKKKSQSVTPPPFELSRISQKLITW